MSEIAVIDRIIGDQAVLLIGEDGSRRIDVPLSQLPPEAQEGSHLKVDLDGETLLSAQIDPEAQENAQQRIADKLARLRKKWGL